VRKNHVPFGSRGREGHFVLRPEPAVLNADRTEVGPPSADPSPSNGGPASDALASP
jgi:hypothetical protein